MNFSPGALQRWILMGNSSKVNGVTVVLNVRQRMMSGSDDSESDPSMIEITRETIEIVS